MLRRMREGGGSAKLYSNRWSSNPSAVGFGPSRRASFRKTLPVSRCTNFADSARLVCVTGSADWLVSGETSSYSNAGVRWWAFDWDSEAYEAAASLVGTQ